MNWGTGIVIAFVCFAGVIATIVTISMKQDVGLVAKDYYKQEIAYQDQIDRKTNYNQLDRKPVIKLDATKKYIELWFPEELASKMADGELLLFRPSTSKWDKKYRIALNEGGEQRINIQPLATGMWRVKVNWTTMTDKQYYTEMIINK